MSDVHMPAELQACCGLKCVHQHRRHLNATMGSTFLGFPSSSLLLSLYEVSRKTRATSRSAYIPNRRASMPPAVGWYNFPKKNHNSPVAALAADKIANRAVI